ncbi:MAG TPA: DUF459 domain-containing protein, partial [Acidimicrobiia bacterium]|nr:DUF459 domain-containing protein [Acidimicrobiia bacterium]
MTTQPTSRTARDSSLDQLVGDEGASTRVPLPAGKVIVVALLALFVGALLNAAGMRKNALGQPVGFKRDVSKFFATPIYDISHAFYIDRLRVEFKSLLGRSTDDQVQNRLPSPTLHPTPPGVTPTTLPPRQTFSPTHMARLWIGGDSLGDTPGQSLINDATATGSVGILAPVDTHIATGLARPEVFNWPGYLGEVLTADQPNAVVLTLGANDDQTLTGDNGGESFGSPAWQAEYSRRVGGLMDSILGLASHPRLFMVGIPPIRDMGRYSADYVLINNIFKTQAALRPGRVFYVDTAPVIGAPAPGGGYTYADGLPNPDGTVTQVRSGDGIHFTRAGGDLIANAILQSMEQAFDLTSWKTPATTATTRPGQHPGASTTTTTRRGTT